MDNQRLYENNNLENEIFNIICEGKDPIDVIRKNNHYDYHYFLSPLRHNLFQWYPFKKEGKLLEIAAGYGQLTELFTRKVNNVVATENSKSKCNLISKRAPDATVVQSDFNNLKFDEKFDYIILCNILEYSKSPIDYLKYLKRFLNDDGVILIALSNRLGIKYFAGSKEEHTNQYFSGINGFSDSGEIRTFTRTELKNIIEDAGFCDYKFFYPYPDHEFTQVIHTDKLINDIPFTGVTEFSDDEFRLFDDVNLNLTLSEDNLSQYFANSFLVELRLSDNDYPTDQIDYVKIHSDTDDEFKLYTTIWADGKVSKSPMTSKANAHIRRMYDERNTSIGKIRNLDAEMIGNSIYYDYIDETLYEYYLIEAATENNKERFFELFGELYDALFYDSFESDEYATDEFLEIFKLKSDIKFHCHEKSNVDLNFGNLFKIDGEFIAIDYEWIFDFQVPVEFLFYVVCNQILYNSKTVSKFTTFEEIFEHFNLDTSTFDLFRVWLCNLLRYFVNRPPLIEPISMNLENIINAESENDSLKNDLKKINERNRKLSGNIRSLKAKNKKLKLQYESLINSNSWKLTKPLRKLKNIFKNH